MTVSALAGRARKIRPAIRTGRLREIVYNTATKILLLLGLLASSTACIGIWLPYPTATNTVTATATPPPTSTSTPSPTPRPTLTPTPALAPVGQIQPIPRGFVYLGDEHKLALGFNMSAGGSIGSLLYNGLELVDRTDYGRYIQLSLYDGNQQYGPPGNDAFGNWGWNPIQAGSRAYIGAKVLEYRRTEAGVYIKAYGKEWGQKDTDSDVVFETWAWLRGSYFEVHVRATHFGSDTHSATSQEFPAAYFSTRLTKQFSYFGYAPFTGQPIDSFSQLCSSGSFPRVTPTENWVAYADNIGRGLILALGPQPYLTSSWAFCLLRYASPAVGYAAPMAVFDNPPNAVHEATLYLIPGPIEKGRAIVYDLFPHTTWTFNLDTSEGWRQTSGTPAVEDGILTAHLAPDDFLTYGNLNTPGASAPSIVMTARAEDIPTKLCLYFLTADDSYWSSDKSSCVPVGTGEFRTYEFDFIGNSMWSNGIITQLRLATSEPSVVNIDDLRVTTNGLAGP